MKKVLHFFFKALFVITMVHGVVDNANALPTYSRKYKEKCSFCHSVWPQLNRRGESFKINGYQLPKTPDGDTKGKAQLSEYSFLDIEDANPPVSAELQVSIVLDRDKKTKALGAKDSRRALLGSTRNFSFYASSTLNKNIAWFAKIKLGGEGEQKTSVEQGYLTINNLDKYQAVNLEIGISNLKQHSVITRHRNALPLEMTRTFGGLTGSSEDSPTLQLFGTPNGNILTYSLGVTDISGDTNNNTAIGGMLRLDFRSSKFAISYNYLGGNMTGINGSVGNSGGEAFDRLSAAVQPNQVHTHFLATRKDWG
ncbi:MAG: hypothetical protein ACE5FU_14045, partial [Nitrospinota bacterium]